MFTIFAVPKAFNNHVGLIQRNAILSWLKLGSENEIILFGNEEGTERIAREFNIRHIPEIKKNEFGTPLLNDIFEKAQKISKNDILAYVNADIILISDFGPIASKNREFKALVVGRRTDIGIKEPINFENKNWEEEMQEKISKEGKLHGYSGVDYFIFLRGLWDKIPPFTFRGAWDGWLLYSAWLKNTPLIDATQVITAIHQNHDYSHIIAGGKKMGWKGPEAKTNIKLARGLSHLFTLRDADFILTEKGLEKPKITVSRFVYFSFHYFTKANIFIKIFLFPGWAAIIVTRKLKQSLYT